MPRHFSVYTSATVWYPTPLNPYYEFPASSSVLIVPSPSSVWTFDHGLTYYGFHGSAPVSGAPWGIPGIVQINGLAVLVEQPSTPPQIISFPLGVNSVPITFGPSGGTMQFFLPGPTPAPDGDRNGSCDIYVY